MLELQWGAPPALGRRAAYCCEMIGAIVMMMMLMMGTAGARPPVENGVAKSGDRRLIAAICNKNGKGKNGNESCRLCVEAVIIIIIIIIII